jgi:hypothetical protein
LQRNAKNFFEQQQFLFFAPTKFNDQQGPYGIFALFQLPKPENQDKSIINVEKETSDPRNDQYYGLGRKGYNMESVPLVQHGLLPIFDEFQKSFSNICNSGWGTSNHEYYCYEALYSGPVPHLTIAIFPEHPQILSTTSEEIKYWVPTSEDTMYGLVKHLDQYVFSTAKKLKPSNLQLHSILLTPDGAMIAGFTEVCTITSQESSESFATTSTTTKQSNNRTTASYKQFKKSLFDAATTFLQEQHQQKQQQHQQPQNDIIQQSKN